MACHSVVVNYPRNVTSATTSTRSPALALHALLAAAGFALVLGLSVFPPSSTRLQVWPWAGFAGLGWLIPVIVALVRVALGRPNSRFGGWLDAGLVLLALAAIVSAFASPLRGAILPHLLPPLGACALPYALLPRLQHHNDKTILRTTGVLLALVLGTSLVLWLQTSHGLTFPAHRNSEPFGHANTVGSVAVLASTWFAFGALRETGRTGRLLFALGSILAMVAAVSSSSRGAVIALAAAGTSAAAIILLRRGRLLLFALLAVLLTGVVVASNARLRDLVIHGRWSAGARESNDQRLTMIAGGLRLGAERPVLGWGAGAVPHVFPRVRAGLPGEADNFVQLHNTPAQLWATLGATGILAALLIAVGLLVRLRAVPWTPDRIPLVAGIIAAAVLLLFDHPFATPVFALLASLHVAAWARQPTPPATPSTTTKLGVCATGLLLVPILFAAGRDLAARHAYASALDHAALDDPAGYTEFLLKASRFAPSDPYYPHLLAARIATGHPFSSPPASSSASVASLLAGTLENNPDLEYAHYNLGWLLLDGQPAAAAVHFRHAARLAPERGAVYYGLGLSRIQLGDTDGAIRAFATEWLLNPATAWSPIWRDPAIASLLPRIHALAAETARPLLRGTDPWSALTQPAPAGAPYRRLRTGYGVLMGHPAGAPPVDFNIQVRPILPAELASAVPPFGWMDGGALLRFLDKSAD